MTANSHETTLPISHTFLSLIHNACSKFFCPNPGSLERNSTFQIFQILFLLNLYQRNTCLTTREQVPRCNPQDTAGLDTTTSRYIHHKCAESYADHSNKCTWIPCILHVVYMEASQITLVPWLQRYFSSSKQLFHSSHCRWSGGEQLLGLPCVLKQQPQSGQE